MAINIICEASEVRRVFITLAFGMQHAEVKAALGPSNHDSSRSARNSSGSLLLGIPKRFID
jgi:hypothetical protein